MESHPHPGLEQFAARMRSHGVLCPVLLVDVRDRTPVNQLLDMLLLQLEVKAESAVS